MIIIPKVMTGAACAAWLNWYAERTVMEELQELQEQQTADMRDWMLFHDGRPIGLTTKQVFFVISSCAC